MLVRFPGVSLFFFFWRPGGWAAGNPARRLLTRLSCLSMYHSDQLHLLCPSSVLLQTQYGRLHLLQDHQGYAFLSPLIFPLQLNQANLPTTGDIPSFKLFESEKVFAFLDIQPLSRGHAVSEPPVLSVQHL